MSRKLKFILCVGLGIIVIAGLGIGIKLAATAWRDRAVNHGEYQAVFLTNSQVYFGKLSDTSEQYIKLTNVYYLQTDQAVQSGAASPSPSAKPSLSLAKLGNELHGPEDVMFISKTQVLFWENLKSSGRVSKAIKEYLTK